MYLCLTIKPTDGQLQHSNFVNLFISDSLFLSCAVRGKWSFVECYTVKAVAQLLWQWFQEVIVHDKQGIYMIHEFCYLHAIVIRFI